MTREQAYGIAAKVLAIGLLKVLNSDPREAALQAHRIGGPSVEELEQRIIKFQAEHTEKAAA